MAHCILRVKKLKTWGSIAASCAHTFREAPTPNANAALTAKNQVVGAKSTSAVMASYRARLPAKRRKDAVLGLEYLVTASPEFFDGGRRMAYFADALSWLKATHGAANVLSASLHLDESTPHLVVYVAPLTADGRLAAKEFVGGPQKLSKMQTDFHRDVGSKFGLVRGVKGSKARHQEVRRFYSGLGATPKLPELSARDYLGAVIGIDTAAMKQRVQAEALLSHRASLHLTTLNGLRGEHIRVRRECEALKKEQHRRALASDELVDTLHREVDIQRAEVIRLREEVSSLVSAGASQAKRFGALQALIPLSQSGTASQPKFQTHKAPFPRIEK